MPQPDEPSEPPRKESRAVRGRGWSRRRRQLLWAVLGGLAGLAVASDATAGRAATMTLAALLGAGAGAALSTQLTRGLALLGLLLGPFLTLPLLHVERLTGGEPRLEPITRRGAPPPPTTLSLPATVTVIALAASATLAAVLLHALSRRIRGERRPLPQSLRSLGWLGFWVTLAMALISNFAPP